MRIYQTAVEMVREVEREVFEMGIRVQPATMQDKCVANDKDYETLEVQAYGYVLTRISMADLTQMVEYLGGNVDWAIEELQDRLDPAYINPGTTHEMMPVWA